MKTPKQSPQLNVRITENLWAELHKLWKLWNKAGHFNDFVVEQILDSYIRARTSGDSGSSPDNLDHITDILVEAVAAELKRDNRWAAEVLLQARFHLPGESVFGDRAGHYSKEKEHIAIQFSAWLVNRIRGRYLKHNRQVCLVIDGGSTLYWVLRKIGAPLSSLKVEDVAAAQRLSFLSINLPGVESYMSFARLDKRGNDPDDLLSRTISCNILSGRLEPRYAAVAVESAYTSLEEYKARHPGTVFIGLVTGNWIRVNHPGSSYPVPLWRDEEQGQFKRGLIHICEEVYVVAPLAKVFVRKSIREINSWLTKVRPQSTSYSDVDEAHERMRCLRLVSTCREPDTLLREHSVAVETILDARCEIDPEKSDAEFADVPSLLFSFPDLNKATPVKKQVEWECPHPGTNTPGFMNWAYQVKPGQLVDEGKRHQV